MDGFVLFVSFFLSFSFRVFPYGTVLWSRCYGLAHICTLPNCTHFCRLTTCGWLVLLTHTEFLKVLSSKLYCFSSLVHIHVPKHFPQLGKQAWVKKINMFLVSYTWGPELGKILFLQGQQPPLMDPFT